MKTNSKPRSAKSKLAIKWPKQVYADISTSHIPEKDAFRLFVPDCPMVIAQTCGGWGHFLRIDNNGVQDYLNAKFSLEFAGLMIRLQEAGFEFVRLDADAPVVKGLPVYPW